MKKNCLMRMNIGSMYLFLMMVFCFLAPFVSKAQPTNTYVSDGGYVVGTSDSRLAATILETETSVVMKVFVVGELRADALDFSFYYKPEVLVLTDQTITQEINGLGDISVVPEFKNALIIDPALVAKGFTYGAVVQRGKGTGTPSANYSSNADMRAFEATINRPQSTSATILEAAAGKIAPVFICYFKKVTPNASLSLDDIGIGVKTTTSGNRYCPRWIYDFLTLTYADDGTDAEFREILPSHQFLYRSSSFVNTEAADQITTVTARLKGNFSRGDFADSDAISNSTNTANKTGTLRGDDISRYGFIYSDTDATFSISEFSNTLVMDGTEYPFPNDAEIAAGTFTRGTKTFKIVATTNSGTDQTLAYNSTISGLTHNTTYYAWSFINYAFQTSDTFSSIGNKISFETPFDCDDIFAGTIRIVSQPTCGNNDGSIQIYVSGGSGVYEYDLNGGTDFKNLPSDGLIEGLYAGTYRVSVRESNVDCGVAVSDAVTLRNTDSDLSVSVHVVPASTCGVGDGSLILTITEGTPPYQYSLNGSTMTNVPADNTLTGLTSGIYVVDIRDFENCIVSSGEVLLNAEDGGLEVAVSGNTSTECGISEGSFTLTVTPGTAPYYYQVDGGFMQTMTGESVIISNLSAGSHVWRVIDATGCYAEGREVINNSDNNNFAFNVKTTNARCDGTEGGSIEINVTGGTAPFRYSYDNGLNWTLFTAMSTTATLSNLAQGSYNIIVEDDIDCTFEYRNIVIGRDITTDIIVGTIKIVSQPSCGTTTGSILVEVSGGTGAYQYAVNGGDSYTDLPADKIITGLSAGTYRISIQDKAAPACGVAISEAITLRPMDTDLDLIVIANNASSCGVADGSLTVTVFGGTSPYTYTLNGVAVTVTDNKIENLTSGVYVVNVTDTDDCIVSSGEVFINATDGGLNAVVDNNTSTLCGNTDGSFRITVNGTAPYQYQIDGGAMQLMVGNTVIVSNLSAGSHVWRVIDATGCYAEGREVINNSDNDNFAFTVSSTDANCDGTTGGTVTITITGGTAPYEYSTNNGLNWTPIADNATSVVLKDLAQGNYDIIVKDDIDCTFEYQNIEVGRDMNTDLTVGTIQIVSQPTCNVNTGSIRIDVNGGSGTYRYAVNGGSDYTDLPADGLITGLAAGTYRIYVRDKAALACGAAVSEAVTLRAGDSDLSIAVTSNNASSCGVDDGSLTVTVTGGSLPYAYTLNGNDITISGNTIEDLTAGVYVVNVTDGDGCLASSGEVVINATDGGLDVDITNNVSTICGNTDGSFVITANGTAPYKYQINGGVVMTMTGNSVTISDLSAGSHVWNITDATGCYAEGREIIINEDNDNFAFSVVTTNAKCDGLAGGSITITVSGGTAPYEYSTNNGKNWTPFDGNSTTALINDMAQGSYDIIVKDDIDCTFEYQNAVIGQDDNLTPPSAKTPQTFCSSATVANLEATGIGVKWYETTTGGIALDESTALIDGNIYYASQSTGMCESRTRTAVKVIIDDEVIIDVPRITSPQNFCGSATIADILTNGSVNIEWYDAPLNGNQLPLTTPLVDGGTYYAATVAGGTCMSILRAEVEVTISDEIPNAPVVTSPQYFCEGAIIDDISVPNNQIIWYSTSTGDTPIASGTVLVEGNYYASQRTGECESELRTEVEVILEAPLPPKAIQTQAICDGSGTLADLTITGAGIVWYATATSTERLPLSTPLTANTTYYAAQSSNNCESDRIAVNVTFDCYKVMGTVFPFVNLGDPDFDKLFPVTVKLYEVPPVGVEDGIDALQESTPVYVTMAINYDGTIHVEGAPKNPGYLGVTENPGLYIQWDEILGLNPYPADNTPLAPGEAPTTPMGLYIIDGVAAGDYVLEISRKGYLTRWGEISITEDGVLGHREILPGDVDGNNAVNAYDMSKLNTRASSTESSRYDPRYDLNGDGVIGFPKDLTLLRFVMGAHMEIYLETMIWIQKYQ